MKRFLLLRKFLSILGGVAALCLVNAAQAVISVGPSGVATITFDSQPSVNDWSTFSVAGSSGGQTTTAQMDASVATNTAAVIGATVLPSSTTLPPSENVLARYNNNASGHFLQTHPGGNLYTLLMAKLQNNSGGAISVLQINYDLGKTSSASSEEIDSHRVYFSLDGTTWTVVPALSSLPAGAVSGNLNLGSWANGGLLYILWADDNASAATTDDAFTIDNFSAIIPGGAVAITQNPTNLTVLEGRSATFTVSASGTSPQYQWYKGSTPVGANSPSYVLPITVLADNGNYTVVVTNSVNRVTSAPPATLTVLIDTNPPVLVAALAAHNLTNVTVTFSEAVDPASATNAANYNIFPTGQFVGGPADLTVFSAVVTNATNVLLTTSIRNFGSNFTLRVNSVGDLSASHNLIATNSTIPLKYLFELIAMIDSSWKYDQSGADLGTAWRAAGYDDDNFLTGPALFEGKRGAVPTALVPLVRTTLSLTNSTGSGLNGSNITFYFRTHFTLPENLVGVSVRITHYIDDGAVFYLNGLEAYRIGVSVAAPGYLDIASRLVNDAVGEGPFTFPITNIVTGDNVLAVEVHQNTVSSSDITMAAALEATIDSFNIPAVNLLSGPTNLTVLEGQPASFAVHVTGSSLQFQWYNGATPIPGANAVSYTIPSALVTNAGSYSVVITNSINSVTSAPATLTIILDTNAPVLLGAVGGKNLTTVTVSFSEALDPATALDAANYEIYPTGETGGGGPNDLYVFPGGITITNATNVLLTIAARIPGTNYTLRVNQLRDISPSHNLIAANSTVPLQYAADLITMLDSEWKYDQTGADLGTAWRGTNYDDSAFVSGVALFAGRRGGIDPSLTNLVRTVLSITNAGGTTNITYYFRTHFTWSGSLTGAVLRLRHYIDDGAVFYLNGQEIYRFRMTGTPLSTTFADAPSVDATNAGPFNLPITNLLVGDNVLAVEVHQQALSSTDVTFAAALEATIENYPSTVAAPPSPPTLFIQHTLTDAILSWSGSGFTLQSAGALLNTNTVWTNIPAATSPHTNPLTGDALFFRLKY